MTPVALPQRLLAKEEIEVLDSACEPRPCIVTRHDIEHDVTALLKRGLTTTSAGGFFFMPYLLQLGAYDLAAGLGPPKPEGLPKERLALGLVFESIFGYTAGIRTVDTVSRADFGLLAGLPFLPSPSTQYRFLQDVCVQDGLDFQTALGQRLVALGHVTPGDPVNVDAHNIKMYSRKAMKQSFITQEDHYGKAIRTFYTQDQTSKKPLMALAAYSGTTVSQVTCRLAALTRHILGQDFLMVADKEWYCGQLIQELHTQYGIEVLTPVKSSPKRLREFEAVPLESYDQTVWGNVAAVYTTMTHFDGPLRMLLKKRPSGKYFALITPVCEMTADTAMPTYTKRWRIENFFAENAFLGMNHLPSLNLNAIQTMLALRLLAFHVVDNFRHDLGPAYQNKTPELIHREFIDGVQGRVQLRRNMIEVSIYGFEHELAAAAILTNLDTKLERAGVDPRIPWLGNRRLRFTFH
jgi:Transposase DDE domain